MAGWQMKDQTSNREKQERDITGWLFRNNPKWPKLPGARTCALFEEGILHSSMGGLVAHPLGWGVEGAGSIKRMRDKGVGARQHSLCTSYILARRR